MQQELNMSREEALAFPLKKRELLFGDKQFYGKVAYVVLPIIIQNTLSNVVSLLDNIMVGQVGTLPMSAVAIINQILFVVYLCIWGAIAGAGIYSTQFFGKGDQAGVRYTMRFKLLITFVVLLITCSILYFGGDALIQLYISADTAEATRLATLGYAKGYLLIMMLGLLPFGITQCYAGTMRESGQTVLPMAASIIAMLINFVFNLLLIFGYLGFPKMGVLGAATATVISRFVEMLIVVLSVHLQQKKYTFVVGLFRGFYIPGDMFFLILKKSLPLLANECLWSLGQATLLQCYSVRGISAVAALNICYTISTIFNEAFISMGNATSIMVGQELGANRLVNARRTAWRLATLSVLACVCMGTILFFVAPVIPRVYNTEEEIRLLATQCIRVVAVCMPINAFTNVSYFTLRAGGKTGITFVFDSCFAWFLSVPIAYLLAHFTAYPVIVCFAIVCSLEFVKDLIGFFLVKRGSWVQNMVGA